MSKKTGALQLAVWISAKMANSTSCTGSSSAEKRDSVVNYILEQYKIMAHIYDQEVSRFWSRFNIFVGFELGVLSAHISYISGD